MGFAEIFGGVKKDFVTKFQEIKERQRKNRETEPVGTASTTFGVPQGNLERFKIDARSPYATPEENTDSPDLVPTPPEPEPEGIIGKIKDIAGDVKERWDQRRVTYTKLPATGGILQDATGRGIEQTGAVVNAMSVPEAEAEKPVVEEIKTEEEKPLTERNNRFIKGILYNENRGAISSGANPYKSVGPTGDLGKYQTSPATLSDWSEAWLGRKYTPEEFITDPDAQERYFNEFLKVKEKYNVSDEDAALMWHRGWGVIGTGKSKEEKEKDLKEYLDRIKDDEISQNYLNSFAVGTQ